MTELNNPCLGFEIFSLFVPVFSNFPVATFDAQLLPNFMHSDKLIIGAKPAPICKHFVEYLNDPSGRKEWLAFHP